MRKYKLLKRKYIDYNGHRLYRIQALKNFNNVKKYDIGGYVESEDNLSQQGNCWLYDDSKAYEYSQVRDNAILRGNAEIFGDAKARDEAMIDKEAKVFGNAIVEQWSHISDKAKVYDFAFVSGFAEVGDIAEVYGNATVEMCCEIYENAKVYGDCEISEFAIVNSRAEIFDSARIVGHAEITGNSKIYGNAEVRDKVIVAGDSEVFGQVKLKGNLHVVDGKIYGQGFYSYGRLNHDVGKDIIKSVLHSLNILPDPRTGKYCLYKTVFETDDVNFTDIILNLTFAMDKETYYNNANDEFNIPSGIVAYRPDKEYEDGDTLILVEVDPKDIIGLREDMIVCRKVKTIAKVRSL